MQKHRKNFIYLDHNATTPLEPGVANAMMPYLREQFGNPSSAYPLGQWAKAGLERARAEVAELLGCQAQEIVFTSGGSESNNMVLKGLIDFKRPEDFHIITSAVEHPAVLNPALFLMELGVNVTIVPVDHLCRIDPDSIESAISPQTTLISIMLANNETGTLQCVREISSVAEAYGVPVHTDAAQGLGKVDVDVNTLGVDFLTVAAHKVYGPKGIGALFIRSGQRLTPLIHGAQQENGRRPGTESTILTAGLGAACRIAKKRLKIDSQHTESLRNRFQELLFQNLDDIVLNGHPEKRLPNTLNVSIPGIEGAQVLDALPDIMASTGAACHDRSVKLSHVLSAMGVSPEIGMGALRFSLGRDNTLEQIEAAAESIIHVVRRMRNGRRK
jgi:cysteine desulfurase